MSEEQEEEPKEVPGRDRLPEQYHTIWDKLYTENEYGHAHQDLDCKLSVQDKALLARDFAIDTKVHKQCVNCQARQVLKYYGYKDEKGNGVDGFTIRCDKVPARLPPGTEELYQKLVTSEDIEPDEAKRMIRAPVDPVSWCELAFGFRDNNPENPDWYLRSYQKEQLRCNSLRMVVREGRRTGKTFAMALKLLHMAFTKKINAGVDVSTGKKKVRGPRIMVVTPYQAQVTNVFETMEEILKNNSELCKEIISGTAGNLFTKTPFFRMETRDGAIISGFVSGVGAKSDGSGGGTMRGQNADVIYMDEMDMIPEDILKKVVLPIRTTTATVMMIATSTPIGKRAMFYDWCTSSPNFKEDYFPATMLPQWDVNKAEIEAENTDESFESEYMAVFIEGSYGVFKPSLVTAARGAYTYADSDIENWSWWHDSANVKERTDLVTVIGIDWNKNAGSEFVVVAYDPRQHHWFVVEAVNVTSSQMSSIKWKQEVLRLNFKWKPDYIYADEGYGHTIIEDLKVEAFARAAKPNPTRFDQETAKLTERLKAFNFSQKVVLQSPIDHQEISKTGKDFLVENTIRVFEEQRIWFPEDDQVLFDQLMHYVVLRRTPATNKAIYGADSDRIGDHRLDALMLALGGLFLEHGMYSKNSHIDSKPSLLSKQFLDKRSAHLNKEIGAADILRAAAVAGVPAHLQVLDIRRGQPGDGPDVHRHIRKIQEAEKQLQERNWGWGKSKRARGDIGSDDKEDVFKTMWARARTSAGYDNDTEAVKHLESLNRVDEPSVRVTRRVSKRPSRGRREITKRRR